MGLMDILNGMQNGPRGQRDPNAKGGMSPITMAILALLAYKAYQKVGGAAPPAPGREPPRLPGGTVTANAPGGGLADLLGGLLGGRGNASNVGYPGGSSGGMSDFLKGGLGGLLAGGAAGSILSGGLDGLLQQFKQNGMGNVADSWVGTGPNEDISTSDLAKSIGIDDIDTIANQTGLSRGDLLSGLREQLPSVIDQLTPNGRLPTEDEASRWL